MPRPTLCATLLSCCGAWALSADLGAQQAPPPTELRGRVVAAEVGVGLGGCAVGVVYLVDGAPMPDVRCPDPVTTTPDGHFRVVVAPPAGAAVQLALRHPDRVPVTLESAAGRLGERHDLEVRMERGAEVRGTLRDEQGRPVRATLLLTITDDGPATRPAGPLQPVTRPAQRSNPFRQLFAVGSKWRPGFGPRDLRSLLVEVGADGRFALSQRLPAGMCRVGVLSKGWLPPVPWRIALTDGAPARIDVVLRARPRLAG
ncbi:MAG: hypothetical protein KAI24_19165, partial [Planctomycetes bacterium]|nr:hypothetical protein [Planctomycetota bacterium]